MAVKSNAAVREESDVPKKKPVLKSVPTRTKTPPTLEVSTWGAPHADATHFGMLKADEDGVGKKQWFENPNGAVLDDVWPLSDLSVKTVRGRWGGGTYTPMWFTTENGVRRPLGRGRKVRLRGADVPEPAQETPAVEPAPAQVVAPAMVLPSGPPSSQEAMSMFMTMWAALQDQNRHAMTLERDSYEARLQLQQDFYKQIALVKTTGRVSGDSDLEKKVDAIMKRLDEDDDDDDAMVVQGSGPITFATIFAQHLPTILAHVPDVLKLARDALAVKRGAP